MIDDGGSTAVIRRNTRAGSGGYRCRCCRKMFEELDLVHAKNRKDFEMLSKITNSGNGSGKLIHQRCLSNLTKESAALWTEIRIISKI